MISIGTSLQSQLWGIMGFKKINKDKRHKIWETFTARINLTVP